MRFFARAWCGFFRENPELEIEHCASIREALLLIAEQRFDLVLLDHDLGSERASQFLPLARQAGFDGRVLVVTAWVSDTEARRLLRQGVSGIFLKKAPLSELTESIRTVAAGGSWLDPLLRRRCGRRPAECGQLAPHRPADARCCASCWKAFRKGDRLASADFRKLREGNSAEPVSKDRRADARATGTSGLRTVRRPALMCPKDTVSSWLQCVNLSLIRPAPQSRPNRGIGVSVAVVEQEYDR